MGGAAYVQPGQDENPSRPGLIFEPRAGLVASFKVKEELFPAIQRAELPLLSDGLRIRKLERVGLNELFRHLQQGVGFRLA